jgi:hypothetical protein
MAFDIYPATGAPISIGASTTTPVAITTERRSGETPPTMYIRVATQNNGTTPTFALQVTGGPISDPLTTSSTIPVSSAASTDVGDALLDDPVNGVYRIRVFLNTPAASAWTLHITNTDVAKAHTFTFVVADSDAGSQQAWHDAGTVPGYDLLQNEQEIHLLKISNNGTGALTTMGVALTGADAGSFTVGSLSGISVPPGGFTNVQITLQSATAKTFADTTATVTSNDPSPAQTVPGHNSQATIPAKIEKLEVALMLDASGSMGFGPDGQSVFATDVTATRWSRLTTGVNLMLDTLANHAPGGGTVGIGIYPNITTYPPDPNTPLGGGVQFPVASPSAATIFSPAPIAADMSAAKATVVAHFPRENGGATPIGAGIENAIGADEGSFGMFGADPSNSRRWMLLMSDGNQNSGVDPSNFYDVPPGGGTNTFLNKKVNVGTIGYGNLGGTVVFACNEDLLKKIASQNGGGDGSNRYVFAQADNTGGLTQKMLKTLLFNGLSDLENPVDPRGVLTTDAPTVTRSFSVTPYDGKVSVIVDWVTFNKNRLNVEIRTPICESIEQPGDGYVVNFDGRYRMFTFGSDFLRNAADPSNPRYGTWRVIITLPTEVIEQPTLTARPPLALAAGGGGAVAQPRWEEAEDSEDYGYQIIVSSGLKLRLSLNQPTFSAGDTIQVTAALLLQGAGLPHAAVTLSLVSPASSAINWLARTPVTAAAFAAAAQAQAANPDIDSLGIKRVALFGQGLTFSPDATPAAIKMVDDDDDGQYVASIPNTTVPGTYELLVTASGVFPDGTHFQRERSVTVHVTPRATAANSVFHIDYSQIAIAGVTTARATATVRPLDPFGNPILIDPAFDPSIVFTHTGGTFADPIIDNHDGSYTRVLTYPPGQSPAVGVTIDGDPVIDQTPVVAVGNLTWVDKVFQFHLGKEATHGANMHRDPNACLGNFTLQPTPDFVSLGGGGSITVGVAGHFIVANGFNDDFTVFVHLDAPPRPYIVYAVASDSDKHWTEVGRSTGVTQSFGLRKCGFRVARAILILDASNRVTNPDGTPSNSPGVSIMGVGIKRVVNGEPDCDNRTSGCVTRIGGRYFRP